MDFIVPLFLRYDFSFCRRKFFSSYKIDGSACIMQLLRRIFPTCCTNGFTFSFTMPPRCSPESFAFSCAFFPASSIAFSAFSCTADPISFAAFFAFSFPNLMVPMFFRSLLFFILQTPHRRYFRFFFPLAVSGMVCVLLI